jgi:hypothetical protein
MTYAIQLSNHPARLAARAAGQKTFDPGYVCTHSHEADRFVISGHCTACSAAKNAKRSTGNRRGRPSRQGWQAPLNKKHVTAVKAAKARFSRPAFAAAIESYNHSLEAKHRSRYLNSLLVKVPNG